MGCVDSLTVQLAGAVPQEFLLTLTTPDGTAVTVSCSDGEGAAQGPSIARCVPDGVFFDMTPASAHVAVEWGGATHEADIAPHTRSSSPTARAARQPAGPDR
jgi:hypothetical protein